MEHAAHTDGLVYAAEVVSSVSLDILIYLFFFHCATVTKNKFNCKRKILG